MSKSKKTKNKIKIHDEEWFEAQERLIAEPTQNTVAYYRKPYIISIIVYLAMLVVTFDYYGAIKGFARLNEWFSFTSLFWSIIFSVLIFGAVNGARAFALITTVKLMREQEDHKRAELAYHILSFPLFGLLALELTPEYAIYIIVYMAVYLLRLVAHHYLKGYVLAGIECQYYIDKFNEQRANYLDKARSVTFVGAPGSGKTVTGGTVAITLAEQRWEQLQFDYFTESARKDYYIKTMNAEKLKRLQALKESYEFYEKQSAEYIPCLVTSIGMQDLQGRYSYTLTPEVYAQLRRVPEYSVLFNDESGREQGCNTSKNVSENVADFYRLNRHFGDFILINTEQGADGNGKYIRKCTDYNVRCYWQEWVLVPTKLQEKFALKKAEFYELKASGELTKEEEQYLLQELYYDAKYIATIGFRKIKTRKEGTPEQGALNAEDEYKIIPSRTIYNYDERAYAELYECADEPLALSAWTSLTLNSVVEDDKKTDVITAND